MLFLSIGPAQKSVPPSRCVKAAIFKFPVSSTPPIIIDPAKIECFPLPLGISYLALSKSHHKSPPLRIVVRTLLISKSTLEVGALQFADLN